MVCELNVWENKRRDVVVSIVATSERVGYLLTCCHARTLIGETYFTLAQVERAR